MFHLEMTKTYWWIPEKCTLYSAALSRYIDRLKSQGRSGTTSINAEIEWAVKTRKVIEEAKRNSEDAGDDVEVSLYGKDWAKIHSLVARYWSWQKQLLDEGLRVSIEEAMEPERKQVELAREALQRFEEMEVPRGDIIKIEFYTQEMKNSSQPNQSFSVGTLININSQFAANVNGNVSQQSEIENSLNKISEEVAKAELSDEIKREYLSDLVSVNAQIAGGNPDKGFLEKVAGKLKTAAEIGGNLERIGAVILPHIKTINDFITSLS